MLTQVGNILGRKAFEIYFCLSTTLGNLKQECKSIIYTDGIDHLFIVLLGMRHEDGNFIDRPDCIIYYEVRGTGDGVPLVVLHGGPGFAHTYLLSSSVWDKFGKDRPVVFYDQRGTGKSTIKKSSGSCTLEDQIDDLEALRRHLGYSRIDLLGHSWGGFLGMAYTARHTGEVTHLILVDSAAPRLKDTVFLFNYIFPETTERRKKLESEIDLGDKNAIMADTAAKFSMLCYSPEKREALVASAGNTAYNYDVNQAVWADVEGIDLTPEIKKFTLPTLVITGRFDINVAPLVALRIHELIPKSRFVVFERSGHLPFFEEPEGFFLIVNEFI